MSDIPEVLLPFASLPAKALSISTRIVLSKHLNPELESISAARCLVQDWRGVAEFLEYPMLDIDNFARDKSPMAELLRQWSFLDTSTIGKLLEAIEAVERYDILHDGQLITSLERDCLAYQKTIEAQIQEASGGENQPLQVPEVTSVENEYKNMTVNEVITGMPEYFDAFVCYTQQDFEFVRQMMHKLEVVHGLKLCIVSRDLMPGCAEYVIMAKLIQDRCRKMIIVLSPDYIDSKECEFQTRFAHSLAPGAKEKKLIPVIYRACKVPSILNHICTVDYTRCDVVDWFWTRLANSLKRTQLVTGLTSMDHSLGTSSSNSTMTTDYKLPTMTSHTSTAGNMSSLQSSPPSYRVSAVLAQEATEISRTSSANSLTETGSNASWTDINPQDELMESVDVCPPADALMESFEMRPATQTGSKKRFFNKILQPFKKHA